MRWRETERERGERGKEMERDREIGTETGKRDRETGRERVVIIDILKSLRRPLASAIEVYI